MYNDETGNEICTNCAREIGENEQTYGVYRDDMKKEIGIVYDYIYYYCGDCVTVPENIVDKTERSGMEAIKHGRIPDLQLIVVDNTPLAEVFEQIKKPDAPKKAHGNKFVTWRKRNKEHWRINQLAENEEIGDGRFPDDDIPF